MVAAIGAAAVGVANMVGGMSAAKKAAQANTNNKNHALRQFAGSREALRQGNVQSLRDYVTALKTTKKGVADAKRSIALGGMSAKQSVLDNSAKLASAVKSNLSNKGYASGSAVTNAMRGVSADTTRAILEVESATAAAMSGMIMQGTSMVSGLEAGIGDLKMKHAANQADVGFRIADFRSNIQHTSTPPDFSGLGSSIFGTMSAAQAGGGLIGAMKGW